MALSRHNWRVLALCFEAWGILKALRPCGAWQHPEWARKAQVFWKTWPQRVTSWLERLMAWPGWQRPALVLLLGGAPLALAWHTVLWLTARWGVGADSDGLAYFILARSLAAGRGYGYPAPGGGIHPMTHFPPGYPLHLAALLPLTGGDEAQAALWLNLGALAALVLLAGGEMFRSTRHVFPSVGLAAWLAVAIGTHRVYPWALSETVFLPVIFLIAWAIQRWEVRPHPARGVLVGLLAAWATYLRWVGLVTLGWVLLEGWLAWPGIPWPRRMRRLFWPVVGGLTPVALLFLANRALAGSATNRALRWHPPTGAQWAQLWSTLQDWLGPFTQHLPGATEVWSVVLVALGAGGVLWAAYRAWRGADVRLAVLYRRWGLFVVLYLAGLVAAFALLDASTPWNWRILSPLFPALSVLAVAALWQGLREHPWLVALAVGVGLLFLLSAFRYTRRTLGPQRLGGGKLRMGRWQKAEVWSAVERLPAAVPVLTNELEETIYYTRRPAEPLTPPRFVEGKAFYCDPVNAVCEPAPYASLVEWAADLAARYAARCVAVVYVAVQEKEEGTAPLREALAETWEVVYRDPSGMIFVPPGQRPCLGVQP